MEDFLLIEYEMTVKKYFAPILADKKENRINEIILREFIYT